MFIQTETTPNPASLKFLPGRDVLGAGSANFPSLEEAQGKSPLAESLFAVGGVIQVFLGADFISVTKDDSREWQTLKPQILGAIMDYFTTGAPVMVGETDSEHTDPENGHREHAAPLHPRGAGRHAGAVLTGSIKYPPRRHCEVEPKQSTGSALLQYL